MNATAVCRVGSDGRRCRGRRRCERREILQGSIGNGRGGGGDGGGGILEKGRAVNAERRAFLLWVLLLLVVAAPFVGELFEQLRRKGGARSDGGGAQRCPLVHAVGVVVVVQIYGQAGLPKHQTATQHRCVLAIVVIEILMLGRSRIMIIAAFCCCC